MQFTRHLSQYILAALLCVLADATQAAEPYLGQFLYQYEGGNVYRVTVKDAKTMAWRCIAGDEKGAHGTETPERFKVAEQIYFVTWTEKSGVQVSQVINFKRMQVYSTIVAGQARYVLSGHLVREH